MEKKTIGSFIATLRKAQGFTQQDIADRLNVSNKIEFSYESDGWNHYNYEDHENGYYVQIGVPPGYNVEKSCKHLSMPL